MVTTCLLPKYYWQSCGLILAPAGTEAKLTPQGQPHLILHHDLPRSYHYHAGTREHRSAEPIAENSDKHAISGPVGSDQDSSGWVQGPLNL
jgi:hypothetical protein